MRAGPTARGAGELGPGSGEGGDPVRAGSPAETLGNAGAPAWRPRLCLGSTKGARGPAEPSDCLGAEEQRERRRKARLLPGSPSALRGSYRPGWGHRSRAALGVIGGGTDIALSSRRVRCASPGTTDSSLAPAAHFVRCLLVSELGDQLCPEQGEFSRVLGSLPFTASLIPSSPSIVFVTS